MVDEARLVAPVRGIDHRAIGDGEEEGVMLGHRLVVIPGIGHGMGDALPGVLDEALPLGDGTDGEGALAGDGGASDLEWQ